LLEHVRNVFGIFSITEKYAPNATFVITLEASLPPVFLFYFNFYLFSGRVTAGGMGGDVARG
jgi:hypothetical protein